MLKRQLQSKNERPNYLNTKVTTVNSNSVSPRFKVKPKFAKYVKDNDSNKDNNEFYGPEPEMQSESEFIS